MPAYLGRLAPTPTGHLHAGHAATFFRAWKRARERGGPVILRIEDLDPARCRKEFSDAAIEDLRWLGLDWDEGPIFQSARKESFLAAWRALRDAGHIYPCRKSRREIAAMAPFAPHVEEPIFPPEWRGDPGEAKEYASPDGVNWRFRVPDGEPIVFEDGGYGRTERIAGKDFGDFLVWNRDGIPAYELAVVADDLVMGVTEIVRGEDLLTSTARQILVARALGGTYPATFHLPLVRDASGRRLAKRDGATTLHTLREKGVSPEEVFALAGSKAPP